MISFTHFRQIPLLLPASNFKQFLPLHFYYNEYNKNPLKKLKNWLCFPKFLISMKKANLLLNNVMQQNYSDYPLITKL